MSARERERSHAHALLRRPEQHHHRHRQPGREPQQRDLDELRITIGRQQRLPDPDQDRERAPPQPAMPDSGHAAAVVPKPSRRRARGSPSPAPDRGTQLEHARPQPFAADDSRARDDPRGRRRPRDQCPHGRERRSSHSRSRLGIDQGPRFLRLASARARPSRRGSSRGFSQLRDTLARRTLTWRGSHRCECSSWVGRVKFCASREPPRGRSGSLPT